jgi:hypothetical protein
MSDARWNDAREYDDRERGDDRPRVYGERDRDDLDPRDSLIYARCRSGWFLGHQAPRLARCYSLESH